MADEMATFHQQIQDTQNDPLLTSREQSITETLLGMPSLPDHVKANLDSPLTYDKIEHALTNSPNNKAAGLNGIPSDLYKAINNRHKTKEKENKLSFDIVKLPAFNDIETNGI